MPPAICDSILKKLVEFGGMRFWRPILKYAKYEVHIPASRCTSFQDVKLEDHFFENWSFGWRLEENWFILGLPRSREKKKIHSWFTLRGSDRCAKYLIWIVGANKTQRSLIDLNLVRPIMYTTILIHSSSELIICHLNYHILGCGPKIHRLVSVPKLVWI